MSKESEKDSEIPENHKEQEQQVAPKDKMVGILLLLIIAGGLWAFMKFAPSQLDKLVGGLTSKMESKIEPGNKMEFEKKPVMPEVAVSAAASDLPEKKPKIPKLNSDIVSAQIIEQFGGADKVEVRHIAFSDDQTKLVAALKEVKEGGELFELFFERDEFGRYVAKGEWKGKTSDITIWPK